IYRLRGRSLMVTNRVELLVVAVVSIACWWLFEFYNSPRFWQSDLELWWHYHDIVRNPYLRRVGYDWAFATIFPALFQTAELLHALLWRAAKPVRPRKLARAALYAIIIVGALGALLPFIIISAWLVPLVWTALFLVFDPLNALRGWPSITADLARGYWRRLAALCLAGFVCGCLWEFWNYWALYIFARSLLGAKPAAAQTNAAPIVIDLEYSTEG
ncbi:MAG TPA: hypothetical protein VE775_09270, partial [Pyrinomonadaceae bacterium]|nr:hypothetical protein [Pyrinomonadaceae bacterium]